MERFDTGAPPNRELRVAGVAILAGTIGFLVLERLAEAAYPGFDPAWQPLSDLGNLASPARVPWIAANVVLATSWAIAFAVVVRPVAGRLVIALNVIPIVGLLVAAAVPLDADLAIHEVAAFAALIAGNLAMLANAERLRRPWREVGLALSGAAVVALSPAVALLEGQVGWGTLERIVVAPLIASLAAFGLALLLDGLRPDDIVGRRTRRRTLAVLALALLLAMTGVGTGITAGGATVVGAEISRTVWGLLPR